MLETSASSIFHPRLACAVEAAARNSGLNVWLLTTVADEGNDEGGGGDGGGGELNGLHLPTRDVVKKWARVRRIDPIQLAKGNNEFIATL